MSSSSNLGCLGFLFQLFGIRDSGSSISDAAPGPEPLTFPYRQRDEFLTPAELSFYRVLTLTLESRAVICPKVSLPDIFFVTRPQENPGARAKIAQKHVDFLLCDPHTLRPLVGIELDDSSHTRPGRQQRDQLVNQVFAAASLPLLHIPVNFGYQPVSLQSQLAPYLPSLPSAHITA